MLRQRILAVQNRVPVTAGSTLITVPTGAAGDAVTSIDVCVRKTNDTTFFTSANIDSHLLRVVVRLDGRPIIDADGDDWMDLMGYEHAIGADNGMIPIRLGQIDGRMESDEDDPAMGTLDVGSLEVELFWTGAIPASSQVDAIQTGRENAPLGSYYAWRKQSPSINGTNRVVTDLGRLGMSDFCAAVHMLTSTCTRTELSLNNEIVLEGLAAFQAHQSRENFRVPNSAWLHLDVARSRRNGDLVNSAGGNVRVTNDYSADPAGAVLVYVKVAERYAKGA